MKTPSIQSAILESLSNLWAQLRAAVRVPVTDVKTETNDAQSDSDFEGWLHGDLRVTRNPASPYGDRAPGYLTRNGLGSLEVGGAQDLGRWRE
jgi:hypothetical protein